MSKIRPLNRNDLDQAASLLEQTMRSGSVTPAPGLVESMAEILFDSPWRDEEIPSLGFTGPDGELIGFLAVHVRRMLLRGEPVRGACSGPLVVAPSGRTTGAGLLLMREFLRGPQAFSFTDGATEDARRLWEGMGGFSFHIACIRWSKIFRPGGLGLHKARMRLPSLSPAVSLGKPLAVAADVLARLVPATGTKQPEAEVVAEELTVSNLREGMETVGHTRQLRPEYDREFLEWLFQQMRKVEERGTLRGFLLRDKNGRAIGWYLYYRKPGGLSQAVQVATGPASKELVLAHLFHDADTGGSVVLQGRVEPALMTPLSDAGVLFQYTPPLALVHSRAPAVHEALVTGNSLLTRMDGEWWMGFHLHGSSTE